MNPDNLKWQKLLWSIVIVSAITFLITIIYTRSDTGPGAPLVLLITWPVLVVVNILIISLRLLRIVIKRYSFVYILTGVINMCAGILGFYLGYSSTDIGGFRLYAAKFWWCILVAVFILYDVFLKAIRGLRKVDNR